LLLSTKLAPFGVVFFIANLGCSLEDNSTRIAVAASLSDVIPPLQEQFVEIKRALGENIDLEIIYGGSGELIAQQRHAGLFSAMFLASREAMEPLIERGRLSQFSPFRLGNSLNLVAQKSLDIEVGSDNFSISSFLINGGPIAIGGLGVPAGDYARIWLNSIEGLDVTHINLVEFPNVRAVLAAVEGGAVNGGFVYATDLVNREGFSTLSQWEPDTGGAEYGYASAAGSQHGAEFGDFIGEHLDHFVSAGFTVLLEGE
jgi:ABC-type molybdate transport system substrate-binding protein